MPWYSLLVFLGGAAMSFHFGGKARRNLSSLGRDQYAHLWVIGAFAGRKYFTPDGWRYRNLSFIWMFGGWLVAMILWFLT